MKKIFSILVITLVVMNCFGQFTCKTVDNGFDEPFKKALCYTSANSPDKGILCMEEQEEYPFIYIYGSYFCDDSFFIDCSFDNGDKFKLYGDAGSDSKYVIIRNPKDVEDFYANYIDYTAEVWEKFWEDMKKCATVKFRVIESHCTNNIYYFNLKGSTNAIKFTTK
jgi:hypothetical protein